MLTIRAFAQTDIGLVRPRNEDSCLLHMPKEPAVLRDKGLLAVVADGVGGAMAGNLASGMAVEAVRRWYYESADRDLPRTLCEAVIQANGEVHAKANSSLGLRGMATTLTALVLRGEKGYLAHVGDSRAYLVRDGALRQLTEDHSLVSLMVKEGHITQEQAASHPMRNVILRSVGGEAAVEPDGSEFTIRAGDQVLLCSDGLHGLVPGDMLLRLLQDATPEAAANDLVAAAKARGGNDNITVIDLSVLAGRDQTRNITSSARNGA